ncbi:MAG: rhodanese-like domain-containing protein [Bryobacteraceae bacterium]|nr:rhodanese-like domain-containing protein [Bryobacteraceae bacterium]MCX7604434.1 rhodanese-like domain-containing protein [Bryobacteraceae bacterium]
MQHSPGFLKLVEDAKSRVRELSIPDYLAWRGSGRQHILIDTREESEWASGRIPGAIHICKGVIERDIERIVPDHAATLVLYCGGGYRSALAADNLQKMGYSNVLSLAGGWRDWVERGLPVEK